MELPLTRYDLESRLEYLEEINRFTIDALEMAASLGDFQSSIQKQDDPHAILKEMGSRIRRLIPFEAVAFYLVDEATSDFCLMDAHPVDQSDEIKDEVEFLIENGTFAWALRENRAVQVSTKDFQKKLFLRTMKTHARIRAMFVGILPVGESNIPGVSIALLSIILLNSANALESSELYRMIQKARDQLEIRVKERTLELAQTNEKMQLEIAERRRTEKALLKSEGEAKRLAQENATIAEIGRNISSTLGIEEVYDRFAEEVRRLIPFDRIVINVINYENNTFSTVYVAGRYVENRSPGDIIPLCGSVNEEMARTRSGRLFHIEHEDEIADRFPGLLISFRSGFRSMLFVPLISKNEVIGGFSLQTTKLNAYTENDLRLAEKVGNQIAGAIANARLFVEHKRAEEALQESEERFRDLYDNAPVGYHEYDVEGRITKVNRTDLEMLGYTREEMIGQFIWTFNVEKEIVRQQIMAKLKGTLPPGRSFERTYRRKDTTTFPVLIGDRLLRNEEGQIIGIRSTIQDIAEQKQAEEKMASLQEQLRQSQKMEAVGRLAGSIAHDFNNLLTVILGHCEISLFQLQESNPLREDFVEIKKAADRAANLTRQLLAFSRRQIMEMKVIDLNVLIRELEKMLRRVMGEDIEYVTLLDQNLGKIKMDPGQMEQVILNLAINAKDAMPPGGKFILETTNVHLDEEYARTHMSVEPGHYVMLSVTDTGSGMSPQVKERLFEPFFTTKEKGTGLGLSTVYGIIKQSGGNIWVYSEPGHGTTFRIYMRRIDLEADTLSCRDDTVSMLYGNETILLAEDESSVRRLAARVLRNQGYKILEAVNGSEALHIANKHKEQIHLLLTDVVMPQIGGKELYDQLKPLRPSLKVLFTSGYTENALVHRGELGPEAAYLQKPFSPVFLTHKVRKILDQ